MTNSDYSLGRPASEQPEKMWRIHRCVSLAAEVGSTASIIVIVLALTIAIWAAGWEVRVAWAG